MQYAIVDIETTGNAKMSGITEIAIIIHNGKEKVDQYHTLINPQASINWYVQKLTGINNAMVASAPTFNEVAEQVFRMLDKKIFVAHNVDFDYPIIKHFLTLAGFSFDRPKLCTIKLAKKIFPNLEKYGLGSVCQALNIPLVQHHRALGDAEATSLLFQHLLANDVNNHLHSFLNHASNKKFKPLS